MTSTALIPFLFVMTLGAVIAFAVISKRRTERRMKNDDAPESTLAKDTPDSR